MVQRIILCKIYSICSLRDICELSCVPTGSDLIATVNYHTNLRL